MTPGRALVRLTAGAEADLAGIYRRRLAQRGPDGDDGAEALLARLVTAIEGLAEWPARGAVPPELEALGIHAYRQLSARPFRVIYLPEDDGAGQPPTVTVMIVADARRDFRTLLEERLLRGG
ncbi:type II toxin-antitoxin system RelE/ParE family toxin [Novosphingobium album (ex Liu et al. 2023)]|uniref:Type II toxin-antitoxin system RelE/ParE family toxin n=1 Tax=Novosphingobium album (ex Liu et al. 2023) TaxID=3031130 RepID=A0ABT5WMK7_9SPHN|nr:type II toxin-antitoxin system RelE/ParE family toxin [Novosphingobium album (ex Liu et al. 2023)]MDE8650517.1 type II toxin-antitoxin system RelE/ParE family toxin [Novosphingobium album (ex Liu et al. 2023)]